MDNRHHDGKTAPGTGTSAVTRTLCRLRDVIGAALAGIALVSITPAGAADLGAPSLQQVQPAPSDQWQFQATLYAWASGIDGDIGIRRLPTFPVNMPFTDVLSHLEGVVMGNFIAKKDNWTLFADVFWSKLGADSTLPTANLPQVDFSQRLLILSGVAGYRLPVGPDNFDLSATAGFRYQRLTVDTTITSLVVPFALSEQDVKDWLDPVFGLALQWQVNEKWFINALADVGGFGLGSKLTSQGVVSVGYNWNASWSTALGYRALYTDYQSVTAFDRDFRYTTTIHGPFMSVGYHF